jgi:hypothetical protein
MAEIRSVETKWKIEEVVVRTVEERNAPYMRLGTMAMPDHCCVGACLRSMLIHFAIFAELVLAFLIKAFR